VGYQRRSASLRQNNTSENMNHRPTNGCELWGINAAPLRFARIIRVKTSPPPLIFHHSFSTAHSPPLILRHSFSPTHSPPHIVHRSFSATHFPPLILHRPFSTAHSPPLIFHPLFSTVILHRSFSTAHSPPHPPLSISAFKIKIQ
jgi:hypothetical protein